MANDRTLRGKVAVVGVGETTYYKRGQAEDPEFVLVLKAILAACEDAGISPKQLDGFASFSNDRNEPPRLAAALDCAELRFSNMQWGGGGGGGSGAVANGAAAVASGIADYVVVYRGLAQGQFGRFGQGPQRPAVRGEPAHTIPYGVMSPAQIYAMRATRLFHDHPGVSEAAQKAVALACYHHAQSNPRAVMHGRPLTSESYDESRWIVEPWKLFDCCQENDGAAAIILAPGDQAKDFPHPPTYVLSAMSGAPRRSQAKVHNQPDYTTSSFKELAPRLFEMAQVTPDDVDVVQSYENFTGGVVMALIEHGFCTYDNADEILTFDNLISPSGKLPLNTSGGNLAECYMHGLELQLEAVRQVQGRSTAQVSDVNVSFVNSGPMVTPVSSVIFGSEHTL